MKQYLPFKKTLALVSAIVFFSAQTLKAHNPGEFVFTNPTLVSGTAGADGAVYRFPSVDATLDALVTIKGRSASRVGLSNIDLSNTGFTKAFQPQIDYNNGNVSGAQSWWMEFEITFVNKGSNVPVFINDFYTTALDIDGDNNGLREWDAFYTPDSYKIENNSQLQVSNFMVNSTKVGQNFLGPAQTFSGVDTNATQLMTTVRYKMTSKIVLRLGATTTKSVSDANRMYSIWFKDFQYSQSSLPVKLLSFSGNYNNNRVTLDWDVAMNEDADYYEIEKSTNGRDFSKVVMLFATDKAGVEHYSFRETVTPGSKLMYRIKLIDKSQVFNYSRIIAITAGNGSSSELKLTGNPVTNKVSFNYSADADGKMTVRLVDMNGRVHHQQPVNKMTGNNFVSIDMPSSAASGIYVLEVIDNNKIFTAKFLK